jgi:hypothetical protein
MEGNKTLNRRRGPDTVKKAIGIFTGISWLLVLLALIFNTYAKPSVESLFGKRYSVTGQSSATSILSIFSNIALVLVILVCIIGFMVNLTRHKRKSDKYSVSLIFFGIVSLIWLIYNLIAN